MTKIPLAAGGPDSPPESQFGKATSFTCSFPGRAH